MSPTPTGGPGRPTIEEGDHETLSFPVTQPAEGHLRPQGIGARLRDRPGRPGKGRTAAARVPGAQPVRPGAGAGRWGSYAMGVARDPRLSRRKNRPAVA